jgi:hypothetical protein
VVLHGPRVHRSRKPPDVSVHEARPSEYRIAVVPDGHWLRDAYADMDVYAIEIAWRGKPWNDPDETSGDRWAVLLRGRCWMTDGEWVYESQPSSRTVEFYRSARFPLVVATRIGCEQAAVELARLERRYTAVKP